MIAGLFWNFKYDVDCDFQCKYYIIRYESTSLFRDAEDALRDRDGYDYDGYRLRVEFPRGPGPHEGEYLPTANIRALPF